MWNAECVVPYDGGAEQQHAGILLAEAIQVLHVDVRDGMHVDVGWRQIAEVDVAGGVDEGAGGCDDEVESGSSTLDEGGPCEE